MSRKNKRLLIRTESVLLGFVLSILSLALTPPVSAVTFWREIAHDIATKAHATDYFLYASLPDLKTCQPGRLSQEAKDRALAGMNRIRTLHGLAPVKYSYLYDRSVQEAALIQAANGYPGHHPSSSARCYTAAGAEGSRTSNLSGFSSGALRDIDPVENMISWTHDARSRSEVAAAGHRRWVLNPFATYLSYGQVHGHVAQKVFDFDHEPAVTPFITVDYVAFPYRTYPAIFMKDDPPWSFSVVENKTKRGKNKHPYFQLATVTVTRIADGVRMPVGKLYMDTEWKGVPNFLSWQVKGWEYETPYQVTIRNVAMQNRTLRTFSYQVYIDRAGKRPASIRAVQAPQPKTQPRIQQPQKISQEAREREARAAARAAKRLKQATRREEAVWVSCLR